MTESEFVFIKDGKRGVVDANGKIVLPPLYSEIFETDGSYYVVSKDNKIGVVKKTNQVSLPFEFEAIRILPSDRFHVFKNGFGAIVTNRNKFIRDTFGDLAVHIQWYKDNSVPPMEMLMEEGDRWYFMNNRGTYSIKNGNDTTVTDFTEFIPAGGAKEVYIVKRNNQWGVVGRDLKPIIQTIYTQISIDYVTGYLMAKTGNAFKLFRPTSLGIDTLLSIAAGDIDRFDKEGIAIAAEGLKRGLINKEGKYVYGPIRGRLERFGEQLFSVQPDSTEGMDMINRKYKSVLPVGTLSNGFAGAMILLQNKEKKMGVFHAAGYLLVPVQYDEVFFGNTDEETDDYFQIRMGNKWGLMDVQGKLLIPIQYDRIGLFENGLSVSKRNGKTGVIDIHNKEVVPFIYDDAAYEFNNFGLLQVKKDGRYGLVDKKGKVVLPLIYESLNDDFDNGLGLAMKNGKWGYVSPEGKEVIPFEYDRAEPFYSNTATVIKNGETFKIDKTGKKIN